MPTNQAHTLTRNHLLTALVNTEYRHLLPHLQRVDLSFGEVVYAAGRRIENVYFPENAVIALLSTLESGATTEVGLVGCEGMVGLNIFLGGAVTPEQAVVLLGGTAMKMKASVLREELRVGSPLQLLLLRYTGSFLVLISQSVVCSQHHGLDQRLARWLLMMHDHSESNAIKLTHEVIASMIGSRRAGVSVAIQLLREAGVITAPRGQVTILNREALEGIACECYSIIREEFDRLHTTQVAELT